MNVEAEKNVRDDDNRVSQIICCHYNNFNELFIY